MGAIPILSGVGANEEGEFATRYPLNLEPIVIDSKISQGQLRLAPGAATWTTGPGIDRGGIVWNDILYRVMGSKLVKVGQDGAITILGDVGATGNVWLDYSFDRLGIGSDGKIFYYAGDTVDQVTDVDLGIVFDGLWVDGYFMTTDGTSVIATEIDDATAIKPLKYGSAEEDPDMVTGLLKVRGEVHVFGRHTIQVMENVGGAGFPFRDNPSAGIPFGCVGPRAKALFGGSFAFVGSAKGEALSVYLGGQGDAQSIASREVADALAGVEDPTAIEVESRVYGSERRLLVHLPTESWCFLLEATQRAKVPIWYRLKSNGPYRLRNAVAAYGEIIVGDLNGAGLGKLSESEPTHFGVDPGWQFEAGLLYNEGRGAIINSLELVGLPGRGGDGAVFLSFTRDGETFTTERSLITRAGQRGRRIQFRPRNRFTNWLGLRFRGAGRALPGIARLEAEIEGLS